MPDSPADTNEPPTGNSVGDEGSGEELTRFLSFFMQVQNNDSMCIYRHYVYRTFVSLKWVK